MARKSSEEVMVVPRPGGKEAVYLKDADGNVTREIRDAKPERKTRAGKSEDTGSDDSGVRSLSSPESEGA